MAVRRNNNIDKANLWRPVFVRDIEKLCICHTYNRYADKTQVTLSELNTVLNLSPSSPPLKPAYLFDRLVFLYCTQPAAGQGEPRVP